MSHAYGNSRGCLLKIDRKRTEGMKKLILAGISKRFIRVWQRNFTVYRQNWKISFITPMLEPLFISLPLGSALSMLVGKIHFQGYEISYPRFIAPALIAINIMNTAFFENTYSSFVRMYYQKTFDAMMATPLTLEEIITGEVSVGGLPRRLLPP